MQLFAPNCVIAALQLTIPQRNYHADLRVHESERLIDRGVERGDATAPRGIGDATESTEAAACRCCCCLREKENARLTLLVVVRSKDSLRMIPGPRSGVVIGVEFSLLAANASSRRRAISCRIIMHHERSIKPRTCACIEHAACASERKPLALTRAARPRIVRCNSAVAQRCHCSVRRCLLPRHAA